MRKHLKALAGGSTTRVTPPGGPEGPDFREVSRRYSDIILASGLVGIIGMMVIPLPTPLLDALLLVSITVAVTMLMVSIHVGDVRKLSGLPTLLLIATLFRLALNVSAARLILMDADAGAVIHSLGAFVVRGSFTVGALIFLFLTVVQFLVIAKGSERVAEVAARFTLETMPGEQRTIDARLRLGAFDLDEARRERADLNTKSGLFGSMDGAMKFVKGDSIAGLIMTAINLIAGVIIGVVLMGFTGEDAVEHFTMLAIGAGLVAQIPALLNAMTAGLIVARLEDEKAGERSVAPEKRFAR